MGEIRKKYDEDFKKNAVKLSYASPKTVKELAEDLGIHDDLPPFYGPGAMLVNSEF